MIHFAKRYHRAILSSLLLFCLVLLGGVPVTVVAASNADKAKDYCHDKYPPIKGNDPNSGPSRAACRTGRLAKLESKNVQDVCKASPDFFEQVCLDAGGQTIAKIDSNAAKYCLKKYPFTYSGDTIGSERRRACRDGYTGTAHGGTAEEVCKNKTDAYTQVCLDAAKAGDKKSAPSKPGAVDVDSSAYSTNLPDTDAGKSQLQAILQVVFGIIGALSVLMIVLAGLRFITAQGNPQEVAKARGTIAYAIAGLLVALAAQAIVALVASKL